MRVLLFLILGLMSFMPQAQAESMTMEIIPLQHRLPGDLIPILKPLVAPGGTVTGMNDQLIIRSTTENLQQLKSLLSELDRALRRLRITVRQGVVGNVTHQEQGISGRISSGNVSARVGEPRRSGEGLVLSHEGNDHQIRYRTHSTERRSDQQNEHFVTATEGHPAFIQSGQSIPLATRSVIINGRAVVVNDGVEYRNVTSGFYVTPQLNGQNVTLRIAPQLENVSDRHSGRIDIQHTETTVSGRLGEWIYLGGVDEEFNNRSNTVLSTTGRRGAETRNISVLVEEIR